MAAEKAAKKAKAAEKKKAEAEMKSAEKVEEDHAAQPDAKRRKRT